MKLIEADAKQMLRDAGIQTPPGVFLSFEATVWPSDIAWSGPMMVKAQVLQGRRGAAGLVMPCTSAQELPAVLSHITSRLNGTPCAGFLCEPIVQIAHEWFIAVDVDRALGCVRASVSRAGGMGVASATSFSIADVASQEFPIAVKDLITRLSQLLVSADAIHAEINPLVETANGELVALDAKIELDDAAAFRHAAWSDLHLLPVLGRLPTERERLYEAFLPTAGHRGTFGRYLELDGDIALILSGGGASLLALDAMQRAGGRAANYLEASGNPEPNKLRDVAKIALAKPGVHGVWIAGSCANFTDIRTTCAAVLQAMDELGLQTPVVIRRDGPHADEAEKESLAWAASRGITLLFHRADTSLEASAHALVALIV